jgi:CheY-like chemotaxis protein
LLQKRGRSVQVALNGRESLQALDKERFDLVLMDVQMPEMDGMEATAAMREMEKGSGLRTPIVALTANAMKGDREKYLASGMDGYLEGAGANSIRRAIRGQSDSQIHRLQIQDGGQPAVSGVYLGRDNRPDASCEKWIPVPPTALTGGHLLAPRRELLDPVLCRQEAVEPGKGSIFCFRLPQ